MATLSDLRNECAVYQQRARQHSEAASAAQGTIDSLNGRIADVNAKINDVRNFRDGKVSPLSDKCSNLTDKLSPVGTKVADGLDDDSAGSEVKNLKGANNNNSEVETVKRHCDQQISRLQSELDGLNGQLSSAQNTLRDESAAATQYSNLARQTQSEINQARASMNY